MRIVIKDMSALPKENKIYLASGHNDDTTNISFVIASPFKLAAALNISSNTEGNEKELLDETKKSAEAFADYVYENTTGVYASAFIRRMHIRFAMKYDSHMISPLICRDSRYLNCTECSSRFECLTNKE